MFDVYEAPEECRIQMLKDLEAARIYSLGSSHYVYAASNGKEIIWSDSRSQVEREGFWIAAIYYRGYKAQS